MALAEAKGKSRSNNLMGKKSPAPTLYHVKGAPSGDLSSEEFLACGVRGAPHRVTGEVSAQQYKLCLSLCG